MLSDSPRLISLFTIRELHCHDHGGSCCHLARNGGQCVTQFHAGSRKAEFPSNEWLSVTLLDEVCCFACRMPLTLQRKSLMQHMK